MCTTRGRYVVDQLQCLGILQTCEVLKVGMPTRVTYTELKEVSLSRQKALDPCLGVYIAQLAVLLYVGRIADA